MLTKILTDEAGWSPAETLKGVSDNQQGKVMVQEIIVTIKNQYGTEVVYPVCEHAKLFARIANTKTLTLDVISTIRALGIAITVEQKSPLALALGGAR